MTLTATSSPANAVVTGATGFVGRHLVRQLIGDGWTVDAPVRRASRRRPALPAQVTVHEMVDSVAEVGLRIAEVEPEVVFHVAAFTGSHQGRLAEMVEANVALSAVVAEAATAAGARLVHVSSAWQHYQGAEYSPVSLYGSTKQAQCDVVKYYAEAEGLDAREVCLFDTYGPDDDRGKLVDLLMDAADSGASLSLSSGRQLVDLTYISDVAAALIAAANAVGPVHRVVVRSGDPLPVRELADLVSRVSGRPIDANWGGRPDRPREMITNWAVASDDIGWKPTVPLQEGLTRLWHGRAEGAS